MINEIHSCLLYRKPIAQSVVGEDYQVAGLEFPQLSQDASNIQRVLLINPDRPETANWRCLELRRLLEQTDIGTMRSRFDLRDGYGISELMSEMVQYFRPSVYGGPNPSEVNIYGKLRKPGYQLVNWHIRVNENSWFIESELGNSEGTINAQPLVITPLPGHDGNIQFPTRQPGDYIVRWASIPSENLSTTAKLLRSSYPTSVDSLASDANSKYDYEERQQLRRVALGQGEVGAQVCAATLLFIGHSSYNVSLYQPDNAQTSDF